MSPRRSSLCFTSVLLLGFSCAAPAVDGAGLHSGPMLGDLRSDSVRIWAGGKTPGSYAIELARADALHQWSPAVDATGQPVVLRMTGERLYGQCRLLGLEPDTTYHYRLVSGGRVQHGANRQEFRTLPAGDKPFSFRVAFGSCAGDWGVDPQQPVFRAIHAMDPDLFLWLGDNVYFSLQEEEWLEPGLMESRWRTQRAMPSLQPLLADTPHYAIWDDHDFGPNDSDGTYPLRDFSLDLFTSYWPNPAAGLEGPDGVFFRFDVGNVAFFMLDTRFDRTPNQTPEGASKLLLSARQWAWLEQGLKDCDADFKVVASGMQVLSTYHRFETWNLFPSERARLLEFLEREAISGVFFLSGDRHIGEAIRLERDGTYPLVEFTSSPMAAGIGEAQPDAEVAERIPGTLAAVENFGLLEFHLGSEDPELSFRLYDVYGRALGRQVVLRLDELQP